MLRIDPGQLVFPRQTHSDHVAVVSRIPESELTDTDALVTDRPGICICIQTADCVPVLLFDPVSQAIGAIHAGWRGTVKKIAGEAISKMTRHYGSDPGKIVAAIGPSISRVVYEVGADVVTAFQEVFPDCGKFIRPIKKGKWLIDLREANRQVLMDAGVRPSGIEISERCSYLDEASFYSARRDGQETGRIVTGIFIRETGLAPFKNS